MYIRGLILRNSTELAEVVPIEVGLRSVIVAFHGNAHLLFNYNSHLVSQYVF